MLLVNGTPLVLARRRAREGEPLRIYVGARECRGHTQCLRPFRVAFRLKATTSDRLRERDEVPPLDEAAPDVPPAYGQVVHRATAKDPAARYESAAALAEALRAALAGS